VHAKAWLVWLVNPTAASASLPGRRQPMDASNDACISPNCARRLVTQPITAGSSPAIALSIMKPCTQHVTNGTCHATHLRTSLRWARATYKGLLLTILPFISVTARVASSWVEKHTKPKPLDLLALSSFITLHEVMVP
jgi:hypothetical protein